MITTNTLTVFPNGTKIRIISNPPIEAIITGISIRGTGHVTYEAGWLHDGTSRTAWFQAFEFTTESVEKKEIGFRP
jgi:hypothetical protein